MPTARDGDRIAKLAAAQGLRMTGQRRTIARVLSEADDHPDVEEVHRRAYARDNRLSLSTVYRTLKLFAERGILERHEFGEGRGRYEQANRAHHDHLIDMTSGRIARELGFRLVGHKLELFGIPLPKPGKRRR